MARTGPNTQEGKQKVSRNAVRHGILSEAPVIPGFESPEDWQEHHTGIIASLEPEGALEVSLAERIALLFWRLRRVGQFETDTITRNIEEAEYQWPGEQEKRGTVVFGSPLYEKPGYQPRRCVAAKPKKKSVNT